MQYNQILYLPRSERKTKGMPFGHMGTRVLTYPKAREKALVGAGTTKSKVFEPIEMDYVVLHEGTNQISQLEWEAASTHPPNVAEIKRLEAHSIITVFEPDEGKKGRNTADFGDFDDVSEIVNNCKDREWLTFSLQVDTRESEAEGGDVRQLIRERLDDLDENAGVVRGGRLSMR